MRKTSRTRRLLRPLGFVTLLALGALASGCDANATQCSVDGDCASVASGPTERFVCGADKVCIPSTGVVIDPPATQPIAACKTNDECALGGRPAVCRAEKCVDVLGDVLEEVTPNYKEGNPIFVGVVAPLTSSDGFRSQYDVSFVDSVKMAVLDWQDQSGGGLLPLGTTDRRPLTAVVCDSKNDAVRIKACLDHMIGVLKVPAIIVRASFDTNIAAPIAVGANTLVFCSDCEASDVPLPGANGLLWFGAPPLENQTSLRVTWGKEIEARVRADYPAIGAQDLKVAYVSSTGLNYNTVLKDAFEFNGKSAAETSQALHWRTVESGNVDWRALGTELSQLAPDIIVTSEIGRDFHFFLLPEVEARWSAPRRPRYIASESESFDFRLQRTIGISDELRGRITGVWASTPGEEVEANYDDYAAAFAASFGYDPGGIATGFESFYALAYGLTASLNGALTSSNVTGPNLAEGMKKLVGGPPENLVDFRAGEIPRGISLLQSGLSIDARGVYSDLEWDPITGRIQGGAGIWCPARLDDGTIKAEQTWSYDPVTKAPTSASPDESVCNY